MSKPANLADLVPTPPASDMNTGLTAPTNTFMLNLLGEPGKLTRDCSPVTNPNLKVKIVQRRPEYVGFRVRGHEAAVDGLENVFRDVQAQKPHLLDGLKCAGMLCCRAVRGSGSRYSDHSWGVAIDLYYGDKIDAMGDDLTQRGLLELYPFFHARKWFWGASWGREDSMHMSASQELLTLWRRMGKL